MSRAIDMTDVPAVSARELGLALKMLRVSGGSNGAAFRRTDAAYWQSVQRDQARKTAVLVRLRAFVAVSGARQGRDC
jgi:hypothetical protein